jgi:glycosyltransferase involved in cell wall biosynthesis
LKIIGIFLNNQFRTGGNRRYLELMEGLAARGNTVYVIMNGFFEYQPGFFKKISLSVKYKRKGFPPASYLFKKHIKKNLREIITAVFHDNSEAIDFIHIHGDTHLKAALFLMKSLHTPLFYAFRANDIDRAHIMRSCGGLSAKERVFSFLYEFINRHREKLVARYAHLVTFQNGADRDRFLKRTGYDGGKTVIIPGNIGLPRCTPEWENKNLSVRVQKIIYIGSLSASKGLWELLKALGRLKKGGYGFLRCYVLGRLEDMNSTLRLIKELEIEDSVFMEGFKDPFPYLAGCDLMVYPTLYDAFPDTVLEALHAGCPVIASAAGGLPEMLADSDLLFESGNVQQIAGKIERCIQHPEFYIHIRELCQKRAAVYRFDWAGNFEKAMKKYLLSGKSSSG